ncbi:MAG: TylF/MycF/NovP-related O-methyltransferase [Pyrinomonadaceae bacterium]
MSRLVRAISTRLQRLAYPSDLRRISRHSIVDLERLENLRLLATDIAKREIPGDFVECGTYTGGSAATVSRVLRGTGRQSWLFDSFEGLPPVTDRDGRDAEEFVGKCVSSEDEVHEAMKSADVPREQYIIKKGWFENTFAVAPLPEKIALLHIDADWYESVLLSLETFHDSVPDGGVIALDDFGYWEGTREAFYDFVAKRGIKPLLERVGDTQAFWIKGKQHNRR